jgi:CBS domain containing-hemolysin-like protein
MIEGAITFQAVPCEEVMTRIAKVQYTLNMETVMDSKVLNEIRENGFSRIPICKDGNRN